jgi:hypothetical protein
MRHAMLGCAYWYLKPQSLFFCRSALQARSIPVIRHNQIPAVIPLKARTQIGSIMVILGQNRERLKNTGKSSSTHGKDIHCKPLLVVEVLKVAVIKPNSPEDNGVVAGFETTVFVQCPSSSLLR